MTYETILYEKDEVDKYATITINRPDKLNAMNKTVIREMDDALKTAVSDPNVNALLIKGAGRAFSAGYDIGGGAFDADVEEWREDMSENCEKLLNIWHAPIPVVAAVHGYALAGALERTGHHARVIDQQIQARPVRQHGLAASPDALRIG